jgi:hypothetical protein
LDSFFQLESVREKGATSGLLRNLGEYEGLLDVDERLVKDLINATEAVSRAIQKNL